MIELYCRRHEGNSELCGSCRKLLEYAEERLGRCPYGEAKQTCRLCPVHCYNPEMRDKIRTVMRWAGPRMIIYHPKTALLHILHEARGRKTGHKQ